MFFFFVDPKDAPAFGRGLERFEVAIDLMRAVDPIMPIGAAASLIYISRRMAGLYGGSLSLPDIATQMGVQYTTFMRHADLLSEGGANVRQLNLLEKGIPPDNRKTRTFRLTDKGLKLLNDIDSVVGGGAPS